ncbi:hypothetical protein HLB27_19655 [Dickeya dadantii]|uniref:hypothetical protein n=1 Tax=Dickeya dadantii TaxID=204038 RepID=UPI00149548CC|nr:hypothetical protein [Dickeya dadantii]NPE58673.1 hypothetical protein [Dickeya dadantii]NPE72556.1 hypothetical protein [Dickeya dadantii]
MTSIEIENAVRAQAKRCTDEIKQAMRKKPKPNWDATVKTIIKKHHQKIEPLGVDLLKFVVTMGRQNGRYGVES